MAHVEERALAVQCQQLAQAVFPKGRLHPLDGVQVHGHQGWIAGQLLRQSHGLEAWTWQLYRRLWHRPQGGWEGPRTYPAAFSFGLTALHRRRRTACWIPQERKAIIKTERDTLVRVGLAALRTDLHRARV